MFTTVFPNSPPHRRHAVASPPKMSRNPLQDGLHRLNSMVRQGRRPGGGGPNPRGSLAAVALGVAGVGGAVLLQNSLFNVDGGHRAIKYKRTTGVGKEIYNEGALPAQPLFCLVRDLVC